MLSKNLKKLRREKKISLRELSLKSGVSKTTISEIENGIVENPTIETLNKIASALDVDVAELISDNKVVIDTSQIAEVLFKAINSDDTRYIKVIMEAVDKCITPEDLHDAIEFLAKRRKDK